MLSWKSASWFYPPASGDPGHDRNARTVQFACFLLALVVSIVVILNVISRELAETPILVFAAAGLVAAMVMNRAGRWEWAARIAFLAVLLTATLLVFDARDGFRSLAMLLFPGMLLLSVMLLDRASYVLTAGVVLVAVAGLGIAERQGLTRAVPRVRSSTTYDSIFFVDLNLLVMALIGSRIARDARSNVFDLRATIGQLSEVNLELRETSEVLRESEQQQVSVYNAVQDVIFHLAVEPEGRFRFISVNAAFLRVTGLSRAMVVGKTVNEVIPESSLLTVLGKYQQAIRENATVLWEETSDYPTGRLTGEVSVAPVFDSKGVCTHLVGSVHDMTAHKRAEIALRESETRLKNAERLAHVGNWRLDLKSGELSWSEEMFRIFGQPRDYTPSFDGTLQTVVPQDRQRVERAVTGHLAGKGNFSIEFQIVRPNGDLRTIACYAEVAVDEEDRPLYLHGACHDLTELRRSQQEDFARQKLESVGALASGIAHDFNNLLGGVLAQAELGLGELAAGSNPEAELKAIRNVALRGSEIVRELMIYAGKESAVLEWVDVSQIVEEMIELLKVSVSKHAVINAHFGEDLPAVWANAGQLRRILMNLVTNASEAIGDRDGVIRVTTRHLKAGRNSTGDGLADHDYLQLEVSDTGHGMPTETQAKVFDPFFTTKSAGHGLGLSIVQGIVRNLGGSICLTSEPGKGTTVQILLPCIETKAVTTSDGTAEIEEPASPSREATILVVEDEYPLRQAVAKVLRNGGFRVLEAADGSSAIDHLRVHGGTIDVMLLDITIPGAPSPEVVVEAVKARPDIRVILTSAYSQEMIADAMSVPQVRTFIRKPFQLGDLAKTLRDVLSP
jgi:PAS domain S-box-containing protein